MKDRLRQYRFVAFAWLAWCVVGGMSVHPAGGFQPSQSAMGWQDDPGPSMPISPGTTAAPTVTNDLAPESFLRWMIRTSGIFGFILMLTAFVMVALILMLALQLQRANYLPQDFLEDFEIKLNNRDYPGAYELARNDDSFVARIVAAGMSRLTRGYDDVKSAMQEVGDDEALAMEHKISYLALIVTVAPILGLMGSVNGLLLSFRRMAASGELPRSGGLADDIATALFTTLEGLMVALPAIIFYTIFKNRLSRLLFESAVISEGLMSRFSGTGPMPETPVSPVPGTASGFVATATDTGPQTYVPPATERRSAAPVGRMTPPPIPPGERPQV